MSVRVVNNRFQGLGVLFIDICPCPCCCLLWLLLSGSLMSGGVRGGVPSVPVYSIKAMSHIE